MQNQALFESYLKKSDYLNDVMNTHRAALGMLLAEFVAALANEAQQATLRKRISYGHNPSPSINSEFARLSHLFTQSLANAPQISGRNSDNVRRLSASTSRRANLTEGLR